MLTVDLKEYLGKVDARRQDFVNAGEAIPVPDERSIGAPGEDGHYRVLLGKFNVLSFLGQHHFVATKEKLVELMDALVGKTIGEYDQQAVKARWAEGGERDYIDPSRSAGTLFTYEIVEHPETEEISLYGTVSLTDNAEQLLNASKHYFSGRFLGAQYRGETYFHISKILAFDMEPSLFN